MPQQYFSLFSSVSLPRPVVLKTLLPVSKKPISPATTPRSFPKPTNSLIAVIGLGYVGLPLAFLIKKQGGDVVGIDVDPKKISTLLLHQLPFHDDRLAQTFEQIKKFRATADFSAVEEAGTVIVCVPTPIKKTHVPDLRPLKNACYSLARHLRPETLVIIESSIYPGTTEEIVQPILEQISGLSVKKGELFLAHCPERINPGDAVWGLENIPRVVGGVNPESTKRASAFYRHILPGVTIKEMASVGEAEAVKMVENAFRDVNIAFVNELATAFEKFHLNISHVIDGAATKPFAFLPHYPGCGVGGHCIPVDPYYLIDQAAKFHVPLRLLETARSVNNHMPAHTADLTYHLMKQVGLDPKTTTIALLGLAYKPDSDDERESPSHELIHLFRVHHSPLVIYDPYVTHPLFSVPSLKEALSRADVVVLATAHHKFLSALTPEAIKRSHIRAVVDGRNCLDKEAIERAGIAYVGIGQ